MSDAEARARILRANISSFQAQADAHETRRDTRLQTLRNRLENQTRAVARTEETLQTAITRRDNLTEEVENFDGTTQTKAEQAVRRKLESAITALDRLENPPEVPSEDVQPNTEAS